MPVDPAGRTSREPSASTASAGAPRVGAAGAPPRVGEHWLRLHDCEDERLDQLAGWVLVGVRSGERVLHLQVGPDADGALLRRLAERLGHAGEATGAESLLDAATTGQLSVLDLTAADADPQQQIVDALAGDWTGVRISSASCRAARAFGAAAYAGAERQLEQLCTYRPVSVMCQVLRTALTDPTASLALALHPHHVGDSLVDLSAAPHLVRISGELDISNADLAGHVVDRCARHEATSLRLDLSDLTFLDVRAGEAVLAACRSLLDRDGSVQLLAPRRHVLTVLRHVGLDPQILVKAA